MSGPEAPEKFFISYSRRAQEDGQLAEFLQSGLEQAGHEVFIDTGIKLGDDWGEEIAKQIAQCDYLVVLLSRESVHSEMVLGEVRRAHRRRRRDGGPYILPIRVRYEGELDYELDSYLARTQYVRWSRSADNDGLLARILESTVRGAAVLPIEQAPTPEAERTDDYRRPRPGVGIPPAGR